MLSNNKTHSLIIAIHVPDGKWFGVGLGAKNLKMSDQPYTIVVDGSGKVSEIKLGFHDKGQTLAKSIQILTNKVENGLRKIGLRRQLKVIKHLVIPHFQILTSLNFCHYNT